ncbi:MAG: sulfite exporter TauE/SafE family protein [Alphaproteobacteria bacterium]|nr:sulfite exporter TauE/SafE family protein [Alphaproteobacteria bacterium]
MTDIIIIYLAAGVFSGFVSGLFGVGGAFALAPALIITLTLQGVDDTHLMHLTIATSLATQLVTAILTSVLRHRTGDLQIPIFLRIAPFVGIGAIIGATIGDFLTSDVLKIFFMCFIGFAILRRIFQRPNTANKSSAGEADLRGGPFWLLSVVSGISGGLLGPGPAIVLAPLLRRIGFAMPIVSAASAALAGLVGAIAAGGYIVGGFDEVGLPSHSLGYLYLPGFACLAIGALVGSPMGIRFSHTVSDKMQSRLFLAYLSAVLITMITHSL